VGVITCTLWKWGKKYTNEHVAKMAGMLKRHLSLPHRIICITDQPKGLPRDVEPFSMKKVPVLPWDYKGLRRMWLYSEEAGILGDRLLQLDIDVVLTDSIDPIAKRDEPFVIWKSDSNWKDGWAYNATLMMITPGAQEPLWRRYMKDPRKVLNDADADGWGGKVNSDQALACYLLKDQDVPVWTQADGVYAYRVFAGKYGDRGAVLPPGCRLVSFHGPRDPGVKELQQKSPWIAQHWKA
jgi:hypothetical protein